MKAGPVVPKGWVREAILTSLSKQPGTLSQVASQLGASKSTVAYHLGGLLGRGLVSVSETRITRGGVLSKTYSLGGGALVLLPSEDEERSQLRMAEDVVGRWALERGASDADVDGTELRLLLYSLFLHLFRVTRSQHRNVLARFGRRVGEYESARFSGRGKGATISQLASWADRCGVASLDVVDIPGFQHTALLLNECLGSVQHPSLACWFLEGVIGGVVAARMGPSWRVERVENPDIPCCCIVVARGRRMDQTYVRQAILSYPMKTSRMRSGPRVTAA